jgi:hypothetical protein
MNAGDLRVARDMAVDAGDTDRIGYIDEWVCELFDELRDHAWLVTRANCASDSFCTYKVLWEDSKGFTGVDHFDTCAEAMLCMLCLVPDVDWGRLYFVDLAASDDSGKWWYCDNYTGVAG